jgi:hypothetical protein
MDANKTKSLFELPYEWVRDELSRREELQSSKELSWNTKTPWAMVFPNIIYDEGKTLKTKNYILGIENIDSHSIDNQYELDIGRPKPVLTSVEVKLEGVLGSLKTAEIHFTVFTIEQLTDYEIFYMTPGMSLTVQWGWTYQVEQNKI